TRGVDVQMRAPVLERGSAQRRAPGDARVVDEEVHGPDPLEECGHGVLVRDDDEAAHASAFRSSLPEGVLGRSSTKRTSRGTLCGESRSRTKSCSERSSTGSRTTTNARVSVRPFRWAPTTAHSPTFGWAIRQCSISAGATQMPPTLIRSSTRPRYQK